jgi:hypothetical protein
MNMRNLRFIPVAVLAIACRLAGAVRAALARQDEVTSNIGCSGGPDAIDRTPTRPSDRVI